jgi:hypothetical protein
MKMYISSTNEKVDENESSSSDEDVAVKEEG